MARPIPPRDAVEDSGSTATFFLVTRRGGFRDQRRRDRRYPVRGRRIGAVMLPSWMCGLFAVLRDIEALQLSSPRRGPGDSAEQGWLISLRRTGLMVPLSTSARQHRGAPWRDEQLLRIAVQRAVRHAVPAFSAKTPVSSAPTVPPTPCAATTSSESSSEVLTRIISAE